MNELRDSNHYWPYSLKDYIRMFCLDKNVHRMRILDCYAGAGSFNRELNAYGGCVVSISPLYKLHEFELEQYVKKQFVMANVQHKEIYNHLVYDIRGTTFDLNQNKAFKLFLSDYACGLRQGRYQAEELPFLPYQDYAFDLALLHHASCNLMKASEELMLA